MAPYRLDAQRTSLTYRILVRSVETSIVHSATVQSLSTAESALVQIFFNIIYPIVTSIRITTTITRYRSNTKVKLINTSDTQLHTDCSVHHVITISVPSHLFYKAVMEHVKGYVLVLCKVKHGILPL